MCVCVCVYIYIMVGVFQWFGRQGFNPRSSHTKDTKMVLDTTLFNIHHYKVRIKDQGSRIHISIYIYIYIYMYARSYIHTYRHAYIHI